jgi:hypothetical protein
VRLEVPVPVAVLDSVAVLEKVLDEVPVSELVRDELPVIVPVFVEEGVAVPVAVCDKEAVIEGVTRAVGLTVAVTDGVGLRVIVEVRDQGLGVWLDEAEREPVLVRLAVMEEVIVGDWLGVTRDEGVMDCVPVVVREEVRLADAVRLDVPVLIALMVLNGEDVCDNDPVPVFVLVKDVVCVIVRVPVGNAEGERLAVTVG